MASTTTTATYSIHHSHRIAEKSAGWLDSGTDLAKMVSEQLEMWFEGDDNGQGTFGDVYTIRDENGSPIVIMTQPRPTSYSADMVRAEVLVVDVVAASNGYDAAILTRVCMYHLSDDGTFSHSEVV